jgi:predicted MFS family arabinose efflux permease
MVNVARAVGPAVAGILIATVGGGWCFLINACSFVFVVGGLKAIHRDELTPTRRATHMKGQLVEGFRYVARRPLLRDAIIMMAIVGCLTYEFQTTLPLLAGNTFHGDSRTYGFFTAFMGVGAVFGGLVAAGRRSRSPQRLVNTLLLFSVTLLLAALAPTRLTEELILLPVGAGMVTFLALGNTLLQLETEPEMRGRVMSLWSVSFLGTTPIGGPIVGFIGGSLGARYGLGVGAAAALLAGLYGWRSFGRHGSAGHHGIVTPGAATGPVTVDPAPVDARTVDPGPVDPGPVDAMTVEAMTADATPIDAAPGDRASAGPARADAAR